MVRKHWHIQYNIIANCSLLRSLEEGRFDGVLAPFDSNQIGKYLESIIPPFRIVSWWDRSGDSRPGSNSMMIGVGYSSAEEILDDALVKFPVIMSRQPRPVKWLTHETNEN